MDGPGRGASTNAVSIAIVGAGFSGLGAALRLKRAGIHDFVVFERADDVGGTWRDNHYPGLCCDVPSHVYSYSFQPNPEWTRGFSPGWEILEYLRRTADEHGIMPHVRFGHDVRDASWDDAAARWSIETDRGHLTARYLISAGGPLTDPKTPDIPGLANFEGTVFHSGRWNHDHDLRGARVAVVGTGASAIQFIPEIQPVVDRLYVFQRTPPWVIPRFDHEITRLEKVLLRRVPFAPRAVRTVLYWLLEVRVVGFRRPWIMRAADRLARRHLSRQVRDPELRKKLTPGYVMGCKRILISDDYYPSLTRPNVEILTEGLEEVRPGSVVTGDGSERPVDTIILGTGFHVTDPPMAHRIRGRGGRLLADAWTPSLHAYLGTTVPGFPNLFFLLGPNTGLGHNSQIHMLESQLGYVLDGLRLMDERGAETFEVRAEVEEAYNRELQASMEGTVWTAGHCSSWYLDDTGRNTTLWPRSTVRFRLRTRRFRPECHRFSTERRVSETDLAPAAGGE